MKLPQGFQIAALSAGIKASGKLDLGLIYSPQPLNWALTSTQNMVKAPCVIRNRSRLASNQTVQAVIVNSGNANCATGDQGVWDNEDFAGFLASSFNVFKPYDVLTASTGVIGQRLPIDKLRSSIPELVRNLSDEVDGFAEAIMTTDTRQKKVATTLNGGARIVGVCKGSGMLHPNMATMLAFIMTDAYISQQTMRAMWPDIVDQTFNQVTVDGDTSTNDMAMLLSSGKQPADVDEFKDALIAICEDLSRKLARDGEGAKKLITISVSGGRNDVEARAAAKAIARSPLVKSAVHGNDPNWGRVLMALGNSDAVADLSNTIIRLQGRTVYQGAPLDFDASALSASLNNNEVVIEVDLAAGQGRGLAWGCDLSQAYVQINADYRT